MITIHSFSKRVFWFLLLGLATVYFLAMAAGVDWGLPAYWNVDERLSRVMVGLEQGVEAVPEEFYYPTLPFWVMLGAGKILSLMGSPELLVMSGVRLVSVLLATLVIVISALMCLVGRPSRVAALLAAVLVAVGSGLATMAHYAHVDIYLTFFVALTALLLLKFAESRNWAWLYLAFLTSGLAASSKYNGTVLLLAGTAIALIFGRGRWIERLGRLLPAYGLAFAGFFAGTPQAILQAPDYVAQLLPFLERQRAYAGPRPLGIWGQWGNTRDGLGLLLFLLFALALLWALWQTGRTILKWRRKEEIGRNSRLTMTLLIILLALELPVAFSRFYPIRYMVPAYPLLAVLAAWMAHDTWHRLRRAGNRAGQWALLGILGAVIVISGLRIVSVVLLFENDGRIAAAEALPALIPEGTRTEHTAYPPILPRENRVVDNYPLVVFKFAEDIRPHTGANLGQEGVEQRRPDYLVIDSKTYERFEDPHVCRLNRVECEFFRQLLAGETKYRLSGRFSYDLPPYLPEVRMDFVNEEVLVYERAAEPPATIAGEKWEHGLDGRFGQAIILHGYDLVESAEDDLTVTLYWSTQARLGQSYKVFVHCLDGQGALVSQSDSLPARPLEYWLRGEIVKDTHIMPLPPGFEADACRLQVGLYDAQTGERLAAEEGGAPVPNGAIPLSHEG